MSVDDVRVQSVCLFGNWQLSVLILIYSPPLCDSLLVLLVIFISSPAKAKRRSKKRKVVSPSVSHPRNRKVATKEQKPRITNTDDDNVSTAPATEQPRMS